MGFFGTATKGRTAGGGLLDRLCRELDWTIDFRNGDVIALHFRGDGVTPQRNLIVVHAEGGRTMDLSYTSAATFSRRNPPLELLAALLAKNNDTALCHWAAVVDGDELSLKLMSSVLAAGVDATGFHLICQLMLKEAAEVEEALHQKGFL